MSPLPADLLAALPAGAAPAAEQWWAGLSDADRGRIANLWDERLEVRFFTPQEDADGWDDVPTVHGGRFAPTGDDGRGEWQPEFFEHLLQDPDLLLAYEAAPARRFHIGCTQHPTARACIAVGGVPVDFTCPFSDEACPLQPLRGARLLRRAEATRNDYNQ